MINIFYASGGARKGYRRNGPLVFLHTHLRNDDLAACARINAPSPSLSSFICDNNTEYATALQTKQKTLLAHDLAVWTKSRHRALSFSFFRSRVDSSESSISNSD